MVERLHEEAGWQQIVIVEVFQADAEEERGTVDVLDGAAHLPGPQDQRVEGVPAEGEHNSCI